jgi:hypothetical protein
VGEAARGFDAAGRELPMRLGQAAQRLGDFRRALGDVSALIATLTFRRMVLGEPDLPLVEDSPEADLIARLRARCTMQAEREIFDRATGATVAVATPASTMAEAAPAEAAGDDLDDIFF